MKVALHSVLAEGREADYERVHARIWPELAAELSAAGITEWSIWRSGRNLFHTVESQDFAAALAYLETSPVNARWQESLTGIVETFLPQGQGLPPLPHVWSLSDQLAEQVNEVAGG